MNNISKELKELILYKIEAEIPPHHKLSIGSKGVFTKEQLKKAVEEEDDVGKAYVKMQLDFLRALARGEISKILAQ
ncbi:hypothetical protein J4442_00490 [Candidatus Woesearchaeota archaeon]|nr:hypothetical protein [Candidatus Woesearchaeota archaeon]